MVTNKIKAAQNIQIESLYQKVMTCTSNEVVLALISKDTENKYFPKSIGTLDFFSVNVRNLSIFYLDRFGLLDSTSIQKESLDTLKDLGKIITYGDGQNKNILSVSQKDIHGEFLCMCFVF